MDDIRMRANFFRRGTTGEGGKIKELNLNFIE
jgi:hypothetical protein